MQYCFACPAEYYRRRSNELGLMFIFIRKSAGEITEPCGTPAFVEKDSDDIPSTNFDTTVCQKAFYPFVKCWC